MNFKITRYLKSENTEKIEKMFGVVPKEKEIFKKPDLSYLEDSQI